jgi:dephospho-CoA kinase
MQVGVTGGIGSGKSIVCKIFGILGIPVYNADSSAKRLMVEHQGLRQQIITSFGEQSYTDSGTLNRSYLADRVFNNQEELDKLNKLVHPEVGQDYRQWANAHEHSNPYIIKEAALLIESGSYMELDYIITVSAPESLRISRVIDRDPYRDRPQVESIIAKQLPEEELIAKSHSVLYNDGKQSLIQQILDLHQKLIK